MDINLEKPKIDWTNFQVLNEYNKSSYLFSLDESLVKKDTLNSTDYFNWAKEDLHNNNNKIPVKTRVEIISNIKRAIDCKCEYILKELGFLQEINKKNYLDAFKNIEGDTSPSMSLISYLTDLNIVVVEEIRKLRNKTEHDYCIPSIEDVRRSVCVGELFLLAIKSKLENIRFFSTISCEKNEEKLQIGLYKDNKSSCIKINNIKLYPQDKYYCELLRILITGNFNELPKLYGCATPVKYIRFKEYYDSDDMLSELI